MVAVGTKITADRSTSESATPGSPVWRVLASPGSTTPVPAPVSLRRIVIQATVSVVVVMAVVAAAAVIVNERLAKQEAVHEVARTTDLLAESIVQPALTNAMATRPHVASAVLTSRLASSASTSQVARVKLWTPSGLVLYSDETRLVGKTFALDDEAQRALTVPQTEAGITDSSRPENAFESGFGKLLEVYRPVWTPDGHPLLFEAYYRYRLVADRSHDLWRGFSGIVISSLAAVALLLTPLLWSFYRRARSAQAQREALMRRAADASTQERQRIAATLHDGVVQQLAAAAFTIAGESRSAEAQGDLELRDRLSVASESVRDSVAGMRSLLVDIYPPSLRVGGWRQRWPTWPRPSTAREHNPNSISMPLPRRYLTPPGNAPSTAWRRNAFATPSSTRLRGTSACACRRPDHGYVWTFMTTARELMRKAKSFPPRGILACS